MIKGFKLKQEKRWINISFIVLASSIIFLKGINNFNTLVFSSILFIIGSFKESIYVEPKGIVFKSYLLFVIPLITEYPFYEATNISFESFDNEYSIMKFLKGNKLKRVKIKNNDVKKIENWINSCREI